MNTEPIDDQKNIAFDLWGKTALITGAASGIGEAIAGWFTYARAHVYIADRDVDGGNRVAARLNQIWNKPVATFVEVDVTDEAQCAKAAAQVKSLGHTCDILVNNAGIGHVGTALTTTGEDLDRLYAVNVRGVFNMCRVFLPDMVARRNGVIINMASIGGVVGIRDRLAYCATKFAVVGLTKCMALDHAMDGVRVNCICPGRVATPFVNARLDEYPDREAAYREMSASQALGRMGTPGEIAAAALYLASDAASFITGSEFIIDGGFSAGK